jgi:membrane-bound ClpP family serine protease
MTPTIWAAVLFAVALSCLILEVFVPSGGVLGFLAASSLLGSVVFVYQGLGLDAAAYYLAGLAVLIPALIVAAIRWWPYTPIGRRILNLPPGGDDEISGTMTYEHSRALLGQKGIAKTILVPSGAVVIHGRVHDAISDGTVIEQGEAVEVVEIQGNNIVVRKIESVPGLGRNAGSGTAARALIEDPFADSA